MASAMIERAEFPVQRKRTLNGLWWASSGMGCSARSGATRRRGLRGRNGLRYTASPSLSKARSTLNTVTVVRALAGREEGLPRNACGIICPRLFRLGVTAGGLTFLKDLALCLMQAIVHFLQLVRALDLDAEVIEPRLLPPRRNGKVHARILKHPFGIIGLHHRRLRREQGRVECDSVVDTFHRDVDLHTFHGRAPSPRRQLTTH